MQPQSRETARVPLAVPEDVRQWFDLIQRGELIPPPCAREWLGDVVRLNYRLLFSIGYRLLGNAGSAEDAVQTAVLRGLQNLTRLRNPDTALAWLATITRNHCLETLRQGIVSESIDDANDVAAPNNIVRHQFEERRLLFAAMNKLSENVAVVVHLRFFKEFEISEIADHLGLSRNTVEVRLHRGLKKLAKEPALQALKGWER